MIEDEDTLCCGKKRVVYNQTVDLNQRKHSGVLSTRRFNQPQQPLPQKNRFQQSISGQQKMIDIRQTPIQSFTQQPDRITTNRDNQVQFQQRRIIQTNNTTRTNNQNPQIDREISNVQRQINLTTQDNNNTIQNTFQQPIIQNQKLINQEIIPQQNNIQQQTSQQIIDNRQIVNQIQDDDFIKNRLQEFENSNNRIITNNDSNNDSQSFRTESKSQQSSNTSTSISINKTNNKDQIQQQIDNQVWQETNPDNTEVKYYYSVVQEALPNEEKDVVYNLTEKDDQKQSVNNVYYINVKNEKTDVQLESLKSQIDTLKQQSSSNSDIEVKANQQLIIKKLQDLYDTKKAKLEEQQNGSRLTDEDINRIQKLFLEFQQDNQDNKKNEELIKKYETLLNQQQEQQTLLNQQFLDYQQKLDQQTQIFKNISNSTTTNVQNNTEDYSKRFQQQQDFYNDIIEEQQKQLKLLQDERQKIVQERQQQNQVINNQKQTYEQILEQQRIQHEQFLKEQRELHQQQQQLLEQKLVNIEQKRNKQVEEERIRKIQEEKIKREEEQKRLIQQQQRIQQLEQLIQRQIVQEQQRISKQKLEEQNFRSKLENERRQSLLIEEQKIQSLITKLLANQRNTNNLATKQDVERLLKEQKILLEIIAKKANDVEGVQVLNQRPKDIQSQSTIIVQKPIRSVRATENLYNAIYGNSTLPKTLGADTQYTVVNRN